MIATNKPIPIAAYARTNVTNTSGSYCGSIQEQLNAIGYWAKHNKCEIVIEYNDECISGNNKCPPALTELANDIEEKKIQVKYVIVCAFNRISRNEQVFMWLHDKLDMSKIKLISLSESCEYSLGGPCVKSSDVFLLKKGFENLLKVNLGEDYE